MEDLLTRLITIVQETAPLVWETAVRQAVVVGAMDILAGLFCLMISFALFGQMLTKWEQRKELITKEDSKWCDRKERETVDILLWVFGLLLCVTTPLTIYWLRVGIIHVLNPAYYAIEILMNLVT